MFSFRQSTQNPSEPSFFWCENGWAHPCGCDRFDEVFLKSIIDFDCSHLSGDWLSSIKCTVSRSDIIRAWLNSMYWSVYPSRMAIPHASNYSSIFSSSGLCFLWLLAIVTFSRQLVLSRSCSNSRTGLSWCICWRWSGAGLWWTTLSESESGYDTQYEKGSLFLLWVIARGGGTLARLVDLSLSW